MAAVSQRLSESPETSMSYKLDPELLLQDEQVHALCVGQPC
jgi:hypothetical protein